MVAGERIKSLTAGVLPESDPDEHDGLQGLDVLARFMVLGRDAMRVKLLAPEPASAKPYDAWERAKLTLPPRRNFPIRFRYLSVWFNDPRFTTLFDLGARETMANRDAAEEPGLHKRDFDRNGPPPKGLQDALGKSSPAVGVIIVDVACRARPGTVNLPSFQTRWRSVISTQMSGLPPS